MVTTPPYRPVAGRPGMVAEALGWPLDRLAATVATPDDRLAGTDLRLADTDLRLDHTPNQGVALLSPSQRHAQRVTPVRLRAIACGDEDTGRALHQIVAGHQHSEMAAAGRERWGSGLRAGDGSHA